MLSFLKGNDVRRRVVDACEGGGGTINLVFLTVSFKASNRYVYRLYRFNSFNATRLSTMMQAPNRGRLGAVMLRRL